MPSHSAGNITLFALLVVLGILSPPCSVLAFAPPHAVVVAPPTSGVGTLPLWRHKQTTTTTRRRSSVWPVSSTTTTTTTTPSDADRLTTTVDNDDNKDEDEDEDDGSSGVRPLHQNWWPVASVDSIRTDRPNEVSVLGKSLVVYFDASQNTYRVLDDRCSHRFAPLSEGRVVDGCRLQCAYHGWEFDGATGACTKVPQQDLPNNNNNNKVQPVQTYPVRNEVGILWVWMDPPSFADLGETMALPVNPLLRQYHAEMGAAGLFMRDLPYGMELLCENLSDLAHLPFSHHSVASLNRDLGGPLPTRMMSRQERTEFAAWEADHQYYTGSTVLPAYQGEILQAARHDPSFIGFYRKLPDKAEGDNWECKVGFYDPCHIRYRRTRGAPGTAVHVELFFCPTVEGRSRVFLYNVFEGFLKGKETAEKPKFAIRNVPANLKKRLMQVVVRRMMGDTSKRHMTAHQIFDGDGIFLRKQGNRMREANLTFRDYSTPASCDVLLNACRRFLDKAASATRAVGLDREADAVVGTNNYDVTASRVELLDRYNSHTVHCSYCMESLQRARQKKKWFESLRTGAQGASGSSVVALAVLALLPSIASVAVSARVLATVAAAAGVSVGTVKLSANTIGKLEKEINGYLFEDYVHAEKN